jgi:uncharacterized protein YecE (DUF72 family)
MARRGRLRIGTSGYEYDHWRKIFYPEGLPKRRWFEHYAERFDTLEVNGTFYGLPRRETFERWRSMAPAGFAYSLKFSRYGSHMKKLRDPEGTISEFLDRAAPLGDLHAVTLVQLPPRWHVDVDRLQSFLDAAPPEHRWAIELRDPSWLCREVFEVLRSRGAALVVHDLLPNHPRVTTADFVYLRFHGQAYGGSYSPQALGGAARRIEKHLEAGRDVFAYFNNDLGGHAVEDALDLKRHLGLRESRDATARRPHE